MFQCFSDKLDGFLGLEQKKLLGWATLDPCWTVWMLSCPSKYHCSLILEFSWGKLWREWAGRLHKLSLYKLHTANRSSSSVQHWLLFCRTFCREFKQGCWNALKRPVWSRKIDLRVICRERRSLRKEETFSKRKERQNLENSTYDPGEQQLSIYPQIAE